MKVTETLHVDTREKWRRWLETHHRDRSEIWLVSYRKHTGRTILPYNDAVEEALCFGWIDSTRKTVDEDRYAQRFTPRKKGSAFSQTNKERLGRLIAHGKVHPDVLTGLGDMRPESFQFPEDILAALKADDDAWQFFRSTSPAYQRIRAAYVEAARNPPEEFEKRLGNLVRKSANRTQFGHDIETYY
jgi:uncharacterized protein YdeI (YjbR/CyaY-like superfamily)